MTAIDEQQPAAPVSWGPRGTTDPLMDRRGLIGAPVSRVDGPAKVTGTARFAAEVTLPGMLYAALAYSTITKGRIAALETGAAEAAPGVALVMTHRNAPVLKPPPAFLASAKGTSGDNLPIMQDDRIRWNGQPIAIVLADTQEQADHARSLIRATYDAEPAITSFAKAKTLPRRRVPFLGGSLTYESGDTEAALAAAAFTVDHLYRTPFENHNAIELHGATLTWSGDELFVHDCVQGVVHEASTLAEIFGLEQEQVHVSAPYVGGAFGGKAVWQHQVLAAAAARLAGRPVRVELSREGVYRLVGGRATTEQRVAIGAQADGRFDALIHTGTAAMTRQNVLSEPFVATTQTLYASGAMKLDVDVADMDMLANTFMRAPGESVGSFALESAIDELAELLGMDPIELRIRNEPDRHPMSGLPFSMRNLVGAFRTGAERFGWSERNPVPGARREGEWLVGMGCASSTYPYFRLPGGAARITLGKDGRATVEIAAHEMGMGTATVHTQVAAERLGLRLEDVTFRYGDTKYPGLVLASGHQQTASIGASVIAAQRALVAELLTLAGPDSRVLNPSLSEYHIPVHMDVPEIDVIWTDIPDPRAPMGALGLGEMGIIGSGAAVANAIYNATGLRMRDLPITLDKLLAAWERKPETDR